MYMSVIMEELAQDESVLTLCYSTGPKSVMLSAAQWNGLRGDMVMQPHV